MIVEFNTFIEKWDTMSRNGFHGNKKMAKNGCHRNMHIEEKIDPHIYAVKHTLCTNRGF